MAHPEGLLPKRRRIPGPAGLLPVSTYTKFEIHEPLSLNHIFPTKAVVHKPDGKPQSDTFNGYRKEERKLLLAVRSVCGSSVWSVLEKYSVSRCIQMEVGCIGCTIHREVIRKYKNILSARVLILIKQVSLFSPTGKNVYVNLTLPNIVQIYPLDQTISSTTFGSSSDSTSVPPISLEELAKLEANFVHCSSTKEPQKRDYALRTSPVRNTPTTVSPDSRENTQSGGISACRIGPGLGSIVKCHKPTAFVSNSPKIISSFQQDSHSLDAHDPYEPAAMSEFLDDGMDDLLRAIAEQSSTPID
ncbi:hypothetical protein FGIG_08914 [Fasciola gigantica]|uniref:Homologous recombination OB-fold protein OB-fold domain-containing protein n=1 Tax=Fasciola gigantica TaxID=46835 RepID=A0A504YJF4_FASGI|nr:hypothetical protein FGIG_08914 [Fasciola gigantica]